MYKVEAERYINAGENEIYRWGKKAVAKVQAYLEPNEKGYYSFPVDGRKYWSIGTSTGKYGEFARFGDTFFSVNSAGYMYAKAGTEKGEKFVKALEAMIENMHELHREKSGANKEEEEEED